MDDFLHGPSDIRASFRLWLHGQIDALALAAVAGRNARIGMREYRRAVQQSSGSLEISSALHQLSRAKRSP